MMHYVCMALAVLSLACLPCTALAEGDSEGGGSGTVAEVRYVTDSSGLQSISHELGGVAASVDAVSDGVQVLQEGVSGNSEKLEALAESEESQSKGISENGGKLDSLGDKVESMDATLRGVAETVNAEPAQESVTLQDFEDVMALVPSDAPESIASYMTPALWGLALGIFAWFISYMWQIVDRLFNF